MVDTLIAIICLALAVAVMATAFIFGRQIGRTERDSETTSAQLKDLQELLSQRDLEYRQLEMQFDQERRDKSRDTYQSRGWDPGQLSDRG